MGLDGAGRIFTRAGTDNHGGTFRQHLREDAIAWLCGTKSETLMTSLLWSFVASTVEILFWVLLFYIPPVAVLWLMFRSKRAYEAEAKVPFTDLPLRPPGESSRVAAQKIFEDTIENLLVIVLASAVFGMAVAMSASGNKLFLAGVSGVVVLGTTAIMAPRVLRSLRKYWNYQLGFKGERLVGEELNQLLAKGYRVFHDVPFNGYNVDHVAVGSSGVFVVETKTRRKWKSTADSLRRAPTTMSALAIRSIISGVGRAAINFLPRACAVSRCLAKCAYTAGATSLAVG